jgi:hypothetical protein
MNHETHTFRHARGTHAAFTTGRDKWFYGVLLHNIGWQPEDDCGTFLLEDGHVETYNVKVVDAASLRLQKGDYSISQYKRGLDAGRNKCYMARSKISKDGGEDPGRNDPEHALGVLQNASYLAFRAKNPVQLPKAKKPPRKALRYKKGACVAAEVGPESRFLPELAELTLSGWCAGKVYSAQSGSTQEPYTIRWATKPYSETQVSEKTLKSLVHDYNSCVMNHTFDGIVGTVIFWPCVNSLQRDYLRQVRVMSFSADTRMYTLHYKDGESFSITPEHLDFASQQSEHLNAGKMEIAVDYRISPLRFVTFTPKHMEAAQNVVGNYKTKSIYGSDFSASSSGSDTSELGATTQPSDKTRRVRPPGPTMVVPGTQVGNGAGKEAIQADADDASDKVSTTTRQDAVGQMASGKRQTSRIKFRNNAAAARNKTFPEVSALALKKKQYAEKARAEKAVAAAARAAVRKKEKADAASALEAAEKEQADAARALEEKEKEKAAAFQQQQLDEEKRQKELQAKEKADENARVQQHQEKEQRQKELQEKVKADEETRAKQQREEDQRVNQELNQMEKADEETRVQQQQLKEEQRQKELQATEKAVEKARVQQQQEEEQRQKELKDKEKADKEAGIVGASDLNEDDTSAGKPNEAASSSDAPALAAFHPH